MKIVILDGYTENPGDLSWDGFRALGELTVYDRTPAEAIIDRIGDAEIVITNKTPIDADILAKCPGIRYIGLLSTGYNIVDGRAAREREIPVTNIPEYGTAAVAQMVFAHLLAVCHRVELHSDAVMRGDWTSSVDFCFWNTRLIELCGKTLGIIGFGRIGRAVARIAASLGMRVIYYDAAGAIETDAPGGYVTLDTLYAESDVISLHCPLLASTEGMINASSIAQMKDGVILINTARGPLVNEPDLAAALDSGKVYAACLDVVSAEPIRADNPLLRAKNCQITPHIAWAPREARERLMRTAAANLEAFLNGASVNVVN